MFFATTLHVRPQAVTHGVFPLTLKKKGHPGFTLIELILAVGIMAIVLVAINAAFFSAIRLREATTNAVDEALPVHQALTILRRDLLCAMPPGGVLSGDFKVGDVTAAGMNQNVAIELFTATGVLSSKPEEPWGDVQKVTYELRPSGDRFAEGQDLIRSVTRNLLATLTPLPEDQWMLSGVQSLEISCYDGSQWLDAWDTTLVNTNLPNAVRVRIQMAGNNSGDSRNRNPIEIVVPLEMQSRTNQMQTTDTTGGG